MVKSEKQEKTDDIEKQNNNNNEDDSEKPKKPKTKDHNKEPIKLDDTNNYNKNKGILLLGGFTLDLVATAIINIFEYHGKDGKCEYLYNRMEYISIAFLCFVILLIFSSLAEYYIKDSRTCKYGCPCICLLLFPSRKHYRKEYAEKCPDNNPNCTSQKLCKKCTNTAIKKCKFKMTFQEYQLELLLKLLNYLSILLATISTIILTDTTVKLNNNNC